MAASLMGQVRTLVMKFKTSPTNRATRVIAALVVLSFGAAILGTTPMPIALAGAVVVAVAGCILCAELWACCRERWSRRDPYDLSLLDDAPGYNGPSRDDPKRKPDAPSWESEEGDTVYCHRCDVSMPAAYSTCPKCGALLGH
jgi:hypothetical protein